MPKPLPESENLPHFHREPRIAPSAFVAPGAVVLGDVEVGAGSSIWYGAVVRADLNAIRIGEWSNLQDGVVVHLSRTLGVEIGDSVSVGHRAVIHACRVGDGSLIGMGAIVMDGAEIGAGSLVAAGTLVTKGTKIPEGSLVMGSPGKVVRALRAGEREDLLRLAESYVAVSRNYPPGEGC